jgi:23S rRNA (cytidine1920-2'-O)/16S rRNA (cytidine1409-2'-O)-methyltransferase
VSKKRLDNLLLAKGMAETWSQAQGLILAGKVKINGRVMSKPGNLVSEDSIIDLDQKPPYVSRGGIKLAHALDEFRIDVTSLIALDIGASTGGFTDCLLQRGAGKVYAIDVGYGQIDYGLRQDHRVVVMDKTNVHYPFSIPEKADLATIDLSFISVTKVIPNIMEHLRKSGRFIVLLKPQFEAERREVGTKGIIKDAQVHARVLGRFISWMIDYGLRLQGLVASPIYGSEGNKEFLLLLNR